METEWTGVAEARRGTQRHARGTRARDHGTRKTVHEAENLPWGASSFHFSSAVRGGEDLSQHAASETAMLVGLARASSTGTAAALFRLETLPTLPKNRILR